MTSSRVVVIVPAYNEGLGLVSTIAELMDQMKDADYKVADGKSIDETVEAAWEMGARVLNSQSM